MLNHISNKLPNTQTHKLKFWLQILNVMFNVMTPYLTFYKTVNANKTVKNTVNCLPSSVCNNTYSGGYQAREEIHYKRY